MEMIHNLLNIDKKSIKKSENNPNKKYLGHKILKNDFFVLVRSLSIFLVLVFFQPSLLM